MIDSEGRMVYQSESGNCTIALGRYNAHAKTHTGRVAS
jgi:hypothetical protein